jgi:AGZA family xanthine/uracil permease-like MFS transporter
VLSRYFRLASRGTSVRIEVMAGLTTFLTMAYIIFVQPAVLSTDFAGHASCSPPASGRRSRRS